MQVISQEHNFVGRTRSVSLVVNAESKNKLRDDFILADSLSAEALDIPHFSIFKRNILLFNLTSNFDIKLSYIIIIVYEWSHNNNDDENYYIYFDNISGHK